MKFTLFSLFSCYQVLNDLFGLLFSIKIYSWFSGPFLLTFFLEYPCVYLNPMNKSHNFGCTLGGGLVAQWITRLTTDQKIPGSNPGELDFLYHFIYMWLLNKTLTHPKIMLTFFSHLIYQVKCHVSCLRSKPQSYFYHWQSHCHKHQHAQSIIKIPDINNPN